MKKNLGLFLLFSLILTQRSFSQLTVDPSQPINLVVQNLLGPNIQFSNVTFNGGADQIGLFNSTTSNLPFQTGVIMGTGGISNALGPNDSGSSSLGGGNFGATDADLNTLDGLTHNDAAILEFDFIATGSYISLDYVFASEEYPEYSGAFSCGEVSDVFGFFLSGPNIAGPFSNGAENIALIPGTSEFVSTNNLNAGCDGLAVPLDIDCNYCEYYVYNGTGMDLPYSGNANYIQYDGMTVVLTATYDNLECGQTYHIKLAIADVSDTAFDSVLFLKEGSFNFGNKCICFDNAIQQQPISVEANLGDNVYFSCIASLGATYQWQILANGVWTNVFNAGQFSGVNTSQLSVSNVNLNNINQQFQCLITSADGGCTDTSNIVSINFCDIASSSIPSVINVSLNSSPNIGITPITSGAIYQWQSNIGFGWMNISDGQNYLGTTTPNLQIINADWQNENEWLQCVVTTNLCSDTTNICVVHITPTGIDETEAGSIYYYENAIHFSKISAALGQSYYVFDGSGKLISEGVYFGDQTIHLDLASSGVYCFKLGDRIIKFLKVN